jgi:hypothetical protein
VNAWGARGQVSAADYAYTTTLPVSWAVKAKVENRLNMAWVAAETSDPNTCVVIDFRTLPETTGVRIQKIANPPAP